MTISFALFVAELHARESVAPYLRKSGNLAIREILEIMWPSVRPSARPSVPQAYECKTTQ